MPQKREISLAELKVGILVAVALVLVGALILQMSWGVAWFSRSDKAITYLPNVGGLKPGAPVWLAGIEIGKVGRVAIVPPEVYAGNEDVFRQISEVRKQIDSVDPKSPNASKVVSDLQDLLGDLKVRLRFVEVEMEIRHQYLDRIGKDSEVAIESKGLLGDSFLQVTAGTVGPLARKGEYYVIEGVRTTGFREIMTGANDVMANFGVLSDQIKNIALKIDPERIGSELTRTVSDMQTAMRQADKTLAQAELLASDLRQGQGTVGRLVSDPALFERLIQAVERFNTIADQMQRGPGTFSKLLNDPALYEHASETLRKAEVMMDRVEKGEGTLGRLSKDHALYDTSKQAIEKLASFVDQIDSGKGTMGKLLKDPGLYNNLNQSTAEMTKLIFDLRQDPKKYLTIRVRIF